MTTITKAALAAELGISKARVSQYCKDGLPVLSTGKLDRDAALNWIKANVKAGATRLNGAAAALRANVQAPPAAAPITDPPAGFEALRYARDDRDAATVILGLSLIYRMPAIAAAVAAEAGAPRDLAGRIAGGMTVAIMDEFAGHCRALGIPPFSADPDPAIFDPDTFAAPDWSELDAHAAAAEQMEAVHG